MSVEGAKNVVIQRLQTEILNTCSKGPVSLDGKWKESGHNHNSTLSSPAQY